MSIFIAAFLTLASTGEPVSQTNPAVVTASSEKKTDAEQVQTDPMVCEVHQELGSRIKRRKVCLRKSEWDRQHLEEKQMIDRTQILRGMTPAG